MSEEKKVILKEEFPANSHKSKEEQKEQKETKPIVTTPVKRQKPSFGKRISDVFLGEDVTDVSSYIIYDILIPAAKNVIVDTITDGINMLLFGQTRASNIRRDKNASYISYNTMYSRPNAHDIPMRDRYGRRQPPQQARSRHSFDEIIIANRHEAEMVLSHLVDLTEDYGIATVADFYDLVGITSSYTDRGYGWESLGNARVIRTRNGYLIDLPRPIVL